MHVRDPPTTHWCVVVLRPTFNGVSVSHHYKLVLLSLLGRFCPVLPTRVSLNFAPFVLSSPVQQAEPVR